MDNIGKWIVALAMSVRKDAQHQWGVYRAGVDLEAVFETAAEALADCKERNAYEKENNACSGHFWRTDAQCRAHKCRDAALTPDGLCAWHAARAEEEAEED